MDEELRQYLAAMEARLVKRMDEIGGMEARLMARLNNSEERILNRLATMEADSQNTKGFLLNDAAVSSRRWLDLEARVTKLERGNGDMP
jgi:hypothetical protein